MPTPYEPVIRHDWPTAATVCGPCLYSTANEPCGLDWCRCLCNPEAEAVKKHKEATVANEAVTEVTFLGGQELWVEPPAKPEDIETWQLTIPVGGGDWGVGPFEGGRERRAHLIEEKSSNTVDLLPLALLILALNVIGLILVVDTNLSMKAVLIVSSICAAILAILSIKRDKEQ